MVRVNISPVSGKSLVYTDDSFLKIYEPMEKESEITRILITSRRRWKGVWTVASHSKSTCDIDSRHECYR